MRSRCRHRLYRRARLGGRDASMCAVLFISRGLLCCRSHNTSSEEEKNLCFVLVSVKPIRWNCSKFKPPQIRPRACIRNTDGSIRYLTLPISPFAGNLPNFKGCNLLQQQHSNKEEVTVHLHSCLLPYTLHHLKSDRFPDSASFAPLSGALLGTGMK